MAENLEKKKKGPVFTPALDIADINDRYLVWADMPGADPASVEIGLEGELLTAAAKVTGPDDGGLPLIYREYNVGDYEASFHISPAVDRDKITAELKDGVLALTLPKAEEVKPRKIEIKAA